MAINRNPLKWGLYTNTPSTSCGVASSAGCGTFSSLSPCSGAAANTCDPALQPVCEYVPVTGTARTTHYFSLRKNNAGAGCATTIAVYLRNTGTGANPTCNGVLAPSGCAGTLGAGTAGPVLYAGASTAAPALFLALLVLALL